MKIHSTTWIAMIGLGFLFLMTASQGKYWGHNEMETYIIQVTEGSDQAYLSASTPTAMVVNQGDINPYMRVPGTYKPRCPVVTEQYVVNNGRRVAKVIVEDCTAKEEPVYKETRHDTTYS